MASSAALIDTLTTRQALVFDFIKDKVIQRGYGPTVREIGEHFKISSPNGVMCHLRALEKKGLLRRVRKHDRAIARAIELAPEITASERGMPLAGNVAAGLTTLMFEQADRVDFAQMFAKKNLFALKVRGDSMIEAHIEDGDYVVVKKQKTAQPGQLVIALTPEGESTLKFWFPEANRVRLQPANKEMQPLYIKDAVVQGVVVGVVRSGEISHRGKAG
jgi:repressor LexA